MTNRFHARVPNGRTLKARARASVLFRIIYLFFFVFFAVFWLKTFGCFGPIVGKKFFFQKSLSGFEIFSHGLLFFARLARSLRKKREQANEMSVNEMR